MTTTALQPNTSKALALLAAGHTTHATAEVLGWPITAVRKVVGGQQGWLIDKTGRVYHPNRPGYKVQLPDGVDPGDLAWARQLLEGADTPRVQFREPAPHPPAKPAPAQPAHARNGSAAIDGPAPSEPVRGAAAVDGPITTDIRLELIHDHPGNIRTDIGDVSELAASISAQGMLQPVTVRPHPSRRGHYQLLAGHRRRAAAQAAGLEQVPAVVRYDVTDATAIEVMLVENVQRRDLNPMEKAEAIGKLRDKGYSGALISVRTGIPQGTVSYLLALLELDDESKARVREGELSVTDAVNAVRRLRKKARGAKAAGSAVQPWSWEPDYLTKTHPLARKAARLCEAREHTTRRRIGQTACGQCWESVIRADERVVIKSEAAEVVADGA